MAARKLRCRPSYNCGITNFNTAVCNILQLALRLGVEKRPLWEMMLERLEGNQSLTTCLLSLDGTAGARALRPLVVSSESGKQYVPSKLYPWEFWQLLSKATSADVAAELGAKLAEVQRLLFAQWHKSKSEEDTKGKREEDKKDLLGSDCDVGSSVEAGSGKANQVTGKLCNSCALQAPESCPRRARRAPKLSRSCRAAALRLSSSCSGSRDSAQLRPESAHIGQHSCDVGQSWPQPDQTRPRIGSTSTSVGRTLLSVGRCWPAAAQL